MSAATMTAEAPAVVATEDTTAFATAPAASETDATLAPPTEKEQKAIDDFKAAQDEVVDLAVQTLDPKDALRKYAKLGKAVLSLARKRKSMFKAWAKEDFDKVCDELAERVKMRVAIKDVDMPKFVRVHLWVEAVRPLVPKVEDRLSYFQVSNKFLPTLDFDPVDLTGEIKKEWLTFVRTAVERQIGDEPMRIKELDAAIEEQKAAIKAARNARKDPEKALEAERKAAEAKEKKERRDGQQAIMDAVDAAITKGFADPSDVAQIVEQALKANKLEMPSKVVEVEKVVGFDPSTATAEDCKKLASAMIGLGKLAEAKVLRDTLDAMLKAAEAAMLARVAKGA